MNQHSSLTAPATARPGTESPVPLRTPQEEPALADALRAIQADSRRQPEIYLRDTVVPHGGE
jgi:hypothetical protein